MMHHPPPRLNRTKLGSDLADPVANFTPSADLAGLQTQADTVGVLARGDPHGDDVLAMGELVVYGLKGLAAYAAHAASLGKVRLAILVAATRLGPTACRCPCGRRRHA